MIFIFLCRFDFVLDANLKADIYQMRFGGLFDCAKLKARGIGLLIYDKLIPNQVSFRFKNISTKGHMAYSFYLLRQTRD